MTGKSADQQKLITDPDYTWGGCSEVIRAEKDNCHSGAKYFIKHSFQVNKVHQPYSGFREAGSVWSRVVLFISLGSLKLFMGYYIPVW